jgi:predicted polyphosphate/ATP-dependent NAD kinase
LCASVREAAPLRLGLIVNPYAGRGGPLALHGSDEMEPAGPPSPAVHERARRALARIASHAGDLERELQVVAAPGVMGADVARESGLTVTGILGPDGPSTAQATRDCAAQAARSAVDLLLFVGGDGTACDVTGAAGLSLPILGVPAGVKMHSGVFGVTPEAAAEVAVGWLDDPRPSRLARADVLDGDEAARREGLIEVRLHGQALIPRAPRRVASAKAPFGADDGQLAAACRMVAADLDDGLVLLGPGTTTAQVAEARGLESSLLGVDAVAGGALVGRDLDEAGLLAALDAHPDDRPRLVLGVIGGQGMLLGRGNQQLSPAVLRRIQCDDVTVLAARDKLLALQPSRLHIDTGDPELDERLSGHVAVRVAPRERVMMEVGP